MTEGVRTRRAWSAFKIRVVEAFGGAMPDDVLDLIQQAWRERRAAGLREHLLPKAARID
jgi:hypothetical protein